jgi:hypothetical protein
MNVYLAGCNPSELKKIDNKIYVLESFAYIKKHIKEINLLINNNFLLDSGAFTFIGKNKNNINWEKYIDEYIDFINKYNIDLYFELDIYSVVGLKKTEILRKKIEDKTGKKSIPVWHIFLGIDYYKKLCEEYDYIAIGASGRHDSKWTRTNPEKLKALVLYAKNKKVKVHGLGYTVLKQLKLIPFYSVDSTTWLNAGKFGEYQIFTGDSIKKIQAKSINKKTILSKVAEMQKHNFKEWIKFQKYAKNRL